MKWRIKYTSIAVFIVLLTFPFAEKSYSADEYEIDVSHSYIGFEVQHMVVTTVRGNFNEFSGRIIADEKNLDKSSVKVVIKAGSIDTRTKKRDDHLRSPDFFDVKKYPEITFSSKKVTKRGNGYVIEGTFTLHGVSKEIAIPFTVTGPSKGPWGQTAIGIVGGLTIDRTEYGLKWNKAMETGGVLVSNEVRIVLNIEAVKKKRPEG